MHSLNACKYFKVHARFIFLIAMELNEVVMNQRGMITIPTQIRKRRKFESGMHFNVIDLGDQIILVPKITEEDFNSNKIDHRELKQSLMEDAERELELENA